MRTLPRNSVGSPPLSSPLLSPLAVAVAGEKFCKLFRSEEPSLTHSATAFPCDKSLFGDLACGDPESLPLANLHYSSLAVRLESEILDRDKRIALPHQATFR